MNEIDHFKIFVLYSGDVSADVDHLHVKKINLVNFSYIDIYDTLYKNYSRLMTFLGIKS
jgi:hypothetical protein